MMVMLMVLAEITIFCFAFKLFFFRLAVITAQLKAHIMDANKSRREIIDMGTVSYCEQIIVCVESPTMTTLMRQNSLPHQTLGSGKRKKIVLKNCSPNFFFLLYF